MNPPLNHPPEQPSEASNEPFVPEPPATGEASPDAAVVPGTTAEARVPASSAQEPVRRRAKTEDFAFLSRLPTRKPETFDADAILRAAWMVGGLALGLWIITLIAKPNVPVEPIATPTPEAMMQEAPPIVMPGNDPPPAPQAISLTPEPTWTPPPPAPAQAPALQAPGAQPPAGQVAPEADYAAPQAGAEPAPAVADTPDPSNLFPNP